jgi:hypothetical protein
VRDRPAQEKLKIAAFFLLNPYLGGYMPRARVFVTQDAGTVFSDV